jgi:hypothetical protein
MVPEGIRDFFAARAGVAGAIAVSLGWRRPRDYPPTAPTVRFAPPAHSSTVPVTKPAPAR